MSLADLEMVNNNSSAHFFPGSIFSFLFCFLGCTVWICLVRLSDNVLVRCSSRGPNLKAEKLKVSCDVSANPAPPPPPLPQGLYVSGVIGDRMNLRYVLCFGLCGSATVVSWLPGRRTTSHVNMSHPLSRCDFK